MQTVLKRLKQHEGLSLIPYKDTHGIWTIGRGHKLGKHWLKPHVKWTLEEADRVFLEDVFRASDQFMAWKRDHYPKLDTVRSEVCVELIFWMGLKGFAGFTLMQKALSAGDYKLAALELYNSKIGKDPKLRKRTRNLAVILWEGTDES
jgi:GH24 family phage-related lysozyme (muramidase)